ncbi:hypothetical protein L2E82_42230 [Cichorium intybus]|uniref:Uncharacterized protein n=1 Tax=Cichorium intybus TaxID=13427 RepID=A0ACB8ZMM0_CICIN|nr:hypothetical protein L2E82_42230 [Cichorium intybus]
MRTAAIGRHLKRSPDWLAAFAWLPEISLKYVRITVHSVDNIASQPKPTISMAMAMAMVTTSSASPTLFSNTKLPSSYGYMKPTSSRTNPHFFRVSISSSPSSTQLHKHRAISFKVKCQAAGDDGVLDPPRVYQGIYGPWSVDSTDIREVISYRSGLVTAATSFVLASSTAFLPDDLFLTDFLKQNIDILYAIGATGLGLSLVLIHIYVTEIKRTLQALCALGIVGSFAVKIFLAQPADESLVQYVVDNPGAVWFIGPLFAALTGLVFKEGLCYGKLEAGILTFIIPSVLLGHLSGLMDDGVKVSLLGVWMALFAIFAARKFTQPIKDDIGDKSVFLFDALPEEEKAALIQKLQQQKS